MLSLMLSIVRLWTRVYTCRLPPGVRDARRAEIESDLWELRHDLRPSRFSPVVQVLGRLLLGMSDDLRWRIEQTPTRRKAVRSAIALATAVALLTAAMIMESMRAPLLPDVAAIQMPAPARVDVPPPPPPAPRPGESPDRNYWNFARSGIR